MKIERPIYMQQPIIFRINELLHVNRSFYLHNYQLFTFNYRHFHYGFVAILPKIRCKDTKI